MYNFRYLLVTIVSIFVSLAIGLLLGAAIAGSDLVRDTSQDMIDSLLTRFDDISTTNSDLRRQLNNDNLLATELVDGWIDQRLDGRTVCIISSDREDDRATVEKLRATIEQAGGATVLVKLQKDAFGMSDTSLKTSLEKIVPPVTGEDYEVTLARALAEEWSYSYIISVSDAPSADDDAVGQKATTPFQDTIYSQYPLTLYLIEHGVIQITADYHLLSEHTNPQLQNEQLAALRAVNAWQLPYGVNALVNTFVQAQADEPKDGSPSSSLPAINYQSDPVALALTSEFAIRGVEKTLPYPAVLRPTSVGNNTTPDDTNNYFAFLLQTGDKTQLTTGSARAHGLAALISLEGETDAYNVVALLSGGKRGVYGLEAPDGRFLLLPSDNGGHLPFVR